MAGKPQWELIVEGIANAAFAIFVALILALPGMAWLSELFTGQSGLLWVLLAIIVFVFLLPMLAPVLMEWLIKMIDQIKKGEFLRPIFLPIKALSSVLGIYGVFKLEYALVHGMPGAEGETWATLAWSFLRNF